MTPRYAAAPASASEPISGPAAALPSSNMSNYSYQVVECVSCGDFKTQYFYGDPAKYYTKRVPSDFWYKFEFYPYWLCRDCFNLRIFYTKLMLPRYPNETPTEHYYYGTMWPGYYIWNKGLVLYECPACKFHFGVFNGLETVIEPPHHLGHPDYPGFPIHSLSTWQRCPHCDKPIRDIDAI